MPSSFDALTEQTRELTLLDADAPPPSRPRVPVSIGDVIALILLAILVAL